MLNGPMPCLREFSITLLCSLPFLDEVSENQSKVMFTPLVSTHYSKDMLHLPFSGKKKILEIDFYTLLIINYKRITEFLNKLFISTYLEMTVASCYAYVIKEPWWHSG